MAELTLLAKATFVLVAALLAGRVARRTPASVRALVLASAFGVLLVLPVVSLVMPPRVVELSAPTTPTPILLFDDFTIASADLSASGPAAVAREPNRRIFGMPSPTATLRTAWAIGAMAFLAPIAVGWVRLRRMRRRSVRCLEAAALAQTVAREASVRRRIEVFLHEDLAAPMTCGLFRPAIGLPLDASAWTDAELRRALVHEVEHVRRGDWPIHLTARVVCAMYWCHPIVWTAWRQLCLESERACDDAVLRTSEGTAYAEQLVTLARHISHRSPAPLLSMADRSNLSTRITAVLDAAQARGHVGVVSATTIASVAVIVTLLISPLQATRSPQASPATGQESLLALEVASVRPNAPEDRFRSTDFNLEGGTVTFTNQTLKTIISLAYSQPLGYWFPNERISGGPDWLEDDRFTIQARAGRTVTAEEMAAMLKTLLTQRFTLKIRVEQREQPIYELVRVKTDGTLGSELRPMNAEGEKLARMGIGGGIGRYQLVGVPMTLLAMALREVVGRPVTDATGLTGRFDGTLKWTPSPDELRGRPDFPDQPVEPGVSVFTALQEQLGLKLEPRRGNVDYLVIEQAERPSPNDAPDPAAAQRAEPQVSAQTPAFEAASIRRNASRPPFRMGPMLQPGGRVIATNVSLRDLIRAVYGLDDNQIVGAPRWVDEDTFDLVAKAADDISAEQARALMRTLLAERFNLASHIETRQLPVYVLTSGANRRAAELQLRRSGEDCAPLTMPSGIPPPPPPPPPPSGGGSPLRVPGTGTTSRCGTTYFPGHMSARAITIDGLASRLSPIVERPVINRTGLSGIFDVDLTHMPLDGPVDPTAGQASNAPSIFTAVQEQLGLKLEPDRAAVEVLVINRVEPPTEN